MKIEYNSHYGSDFIKVKNEVGLEVILSSVGAGIYQITYDGIKTLSTPENLKIYVNPNAAYYGKTIGPIAGRVKGGLIKVDNKANKLPLNEGKNSLHSGSLCFAYAPFKYEVNEIEDYFEVRFKNKFKPTKDVFDADLDVVIAYRIAKNEPILEYSYYVTPNKDCPINITNHSYFNLNGKGDILTHKLEIAASKVTSYEPDLIVKSIDEVSPALDFRKLKEVGKDIKAKELAAPRLQGYDHCFIFDKVDSNIKATLLGDKIGLNLYTSSSGLQVYSCNFPNRDIKLDRWEFEAQYSSITLEEVNAPYGLDSMLIKANESYVRTHKYEFFKKGE